MVCRSFSHSWLIIIIANVKKWFEWPPDSDKYVLLWFIIQNIWIRGQITRHQYKVIWVCIFRAAWGTMDATADRYARLFRWNCELKNMSIIFYLYKPNIWWGPSFKIDRYNHPNILSIHFNPSEVTDCYQRLWRFSLRGLDKRPQFLWKLQLDRWKKQPPGPKRLHWKSSFSWTFLFIFFFFRRRRIGWNLKPMTTFNAFSVQTVRMPIYWIISTISKQDRSDSHLLT